MAYSEIAVFYKLLGHIIFRIFSSQCHNSLVFAVWQIANNLSPIAKKFQFLFLALRIISVQKTSNNLACAVQLFLWLFCAGFALLKTGLSN